MNGCRTCRHVRPDNGYGSMGCAILTEPYPQHKSSAGPDVVALRGRTQRDADGYPKFSRSCPGWSEK